MTSRFMAVMAAAVLALSMALSPTSAEARKNIVRTAANAGQFNTLIAAAKAAGLANVLASRRNLTVFAPTDAAFAKLGKKTIRNLLKPRNRKKLRKILLYHVLGKRVTAGRIKFGRSRAHTLAGPGVHLRKTRKGVRVNRSKVVAANVRASNGVIHVIDRVLIPN
ncbi:MAG: fasciclin domain-containing protein [Pseudomonadota bacterium]